MKARLTPRYGDVYRDDNDGEIVMVVSKSAIEYEHAWKVVHLGGEGVWDDGDQDQFVTDRDLRPRETQKWVRVG